MSNKNLLQCTKEQIAVKAKYYLSFKTKTKKITKQIGDKLLITRAIDSSSSASLIKFLKGQGIETLYFLALFLFAAGLINGMIEGSRPQVQSYMIFPQRGIQTIPETFVYIFTIATGSIGLYLINLGGLEKVKKRVSNFYVVLGFSTVIFALAMTLYIFSVKI